MSNPFANMSDIDFLFALGECLGGKRITRKGWNGAGMWVAHIPASTAHINDMGLNNEPEWAIKLARELGGTLHFAAKFALKDTNNHIQVGWAPSQADMCANDWIVLDD